MSKRKGDFRSKIDSILSDAPDTAPAGGAPTGLDRLFGAEGNGRQAESTQALERHVAPTTETKLDEIGLSKVKLGRGRRTDADPELSESIRKSGILQPLLLRPSGDGFDVLDGGRRLAVARELGLKTVPAVVRIIDDREARGMASERQAPVEAPATRRERQPAPTKARPVRGSTGGSRRSAVAAAATAGAAAGAAGATRSKAASPIPAPKRARPAARPAAARTAPAPSPKKSAAPPKPESKTASSKAAATKTAVAKPASRDAASTKSAPTKAASSKSAPAKAVPAKAVPAKAAPSKVAARPGPKARAVSATTKTAATRASKGRGTAPLAASAAAAAAPAKAVAKPPASSTSNATESKRDGAAAKVKATPRSASTAKPAAAATAAAAAGVAGASLAMRERSHRKEEAPVAAAAAREVESAPPAADDTLEMRPPQAEPVQDREAPREGADDTVELRPAAAAATEETVIWTRPDGGPARWEPEQEAMAARRAEPAAAESTTASFPRADSESEMRRIGAPIAGSGELAAASSRGRELLATALVMLAAFALAFAGTMLLVFHDSGTALLAGVVLIVSLALFAAVSMTGRRTGP